MGNTKYNYICSMKEKWISMEKRQPLPISICLRRWRHFPHARANFGHSWRMEDKTPSDGNGGVAELVTAILIVV